MPTTVVRVARMTRTIFTGGLVVDGTGGTPAEADVVVEEGRIVDVGPGLDGDEVVDCSGAFVAPGFFDSEMTEQYPPGYLDSQERRIVAGRKGDPAELAATVVFLASDAAGYITGQTLAIDGGWTAI